MTHSDCFAIHASEVAAKIIDGEVILIRLSDGMYYSMDGTAASIWEAIQRKGSFGECVENLTTRYDVAAEQAETDVRKLLNELVDDALIIPCPEQDEGQSAIDRIANDHAREAYAPPVLNRYSDMNDLLALDPPLPGMADVAWE